MPAISDPGGGLVAAAAAAGAAVYPIPGPCAALCGVVGSGLATESFLFCGFLPPKTAARRAALARLAGQRATLVFYAPPHGLVAVMEDAVAELGAARRACVARELTKLHEEFHRWAGRGAAGFIIDLLCVLHNLGRQQDSSPRLACCIRYRTAALSGGDRMAATPQPQRTAADTV